MNPLDDALTAGNAGGKFNSEVKNFVLDRIRRNVVASGRLVFDIQRVP